ncbi:MAG: CoA transferase [Candidatus Binataceae bacterium]|jgi:crotonobetainyl-CoA:carnitine CoA-transferase CaiB-like acyl-CoA transferase
MEKGGKPGPLGGVRVLDLGHYIAIPILTRMMADLGAEIIKIEAAPHGDLTRFTPYIKNGYSGSFIQHNRGKQSVCVDLKTPEGAAIVRELAHSVDVITENYSPGVLARYGLAYEDFRKINPRVIMLSISGFGQDGPLKHRVGNDTVALAMSGLMHLTGDPDGPPVYVGLFIADENAGVHGLAAVCAALYYREKTGIGQYIDLSLLECMFHLHDTAIQFYVMSDGELNPNRFGSHHYLLAPCGIFKASDGYVVITVLDHQWEAFVTAIGRREWLTDPRFATREARLDKKLELAKELEQWLQSYASRDEPIAILEKARILAAPVLDIAQIINHPVIQERGAMQSIPHPGLGPIALPKSPFRMSETPVMIRNRAPLLGEHNERVLAKYLGYSAGKVAELTKAGVLTQDPRVAEFRSKGELE